MNPVQAVTGQVTQKTTMLGAVIGVMGVIAPQLTPAFFTSVGIQPQYASMAAMLVAGILAGYQEKTPAPGEGK